MHDIEVEATRADWVRDRELALIGLHDLKSLIWAVRVCVDMLARETPEQVDQATRQRLTATLERLTGRVAALAEDMMQGLSRAAHSPSSVPHATGLPDEAKRH